MSWNLCTEYGTTGACSEGVHTVYVRFYSSAGGLLYGPFSASIYYGTPPAGFTLPPPPQSPAESLLGNIYDFLKGLIPDFLKPAPPEKEVPVALIVPKETPFSMRRAWVLLPREAIRRFVFAPLPKELGNLAQKFETLDSTFKSVGIARQADVSKLRGISLRIPGLADSMLPKAGIAGAKLGEFSGIPLASLSVKMKQAIPVEAVFVRAEDETIDLPISVVVNERGMPEQKFTTVARTILKLVVKPDRPAKQIIGYLAFKSKGGGRQVGIMSLPVPDEVAPNARTSFFASAADTLGTLLGAAPQDTEERFTLRQFTYADPDGDGIYTATIQAPVVDGAYDIYTIITYEDRRVANNELKLTAVVDPEGYVYEQVSGKELRIPGAIVSMMWLNPETSQYEMWPAAKFNQENPQVTDVRGSYAFLVPPGTYSLFISAPGYGNYQGKPFKVEEGGSGVHVNIELSSGKQWMDIFDWKTDLLILIALLLAYNFYVDRRRAWGAQREKSGEVLP